MKTKTIRINETQVVALVEVNAHMFYAVYHAPDVEVEPTQAEIAEDYENGKTVKKNAFKKYFGQYGY